MTALSASTSTSKSSMKQPKSRVVTLRLSPDALAKFPSDPSSASIKSTSSSSTNSSNPPPSNPVAEASPSAGASDSNATPAPPTSTNSNNLLAPPPNQVKRKGIPGPKPGTKRNASQIAIDNVPKPRGKPGPKKKPRPGETVSGAGGAVAPAAPKLGPKANQGAINAHLRALDRTGKPCRKWLRQGFKLRSFTGVAWNLSSWATHKKALQTDFAGDVKSESSGGSSELKGIHESSAAQSDKSNSGADGDTPMPLAVAASSPAPVAGSANAE